MSERFVYVLFGVTGEYSDRSEWCVRAYEDKEVAEAESARLNAIATDIFKSHHKYGGAGRDQAIAERLTPHDANAGMDYTGTHYSVEAVPLVEAK